MKLLKKFDVYSFYTLLLFTFNHLATAGNFFLLTHFNSLFPKHFKISDLVDNS